MSAVAEELARRAEPERLKAYASEKITELKEKAKEAASEKADEMKVRAKEAVMRKGTEFKERADVPTNWSMIGAIFGAGLGSALMKKVYDMRHRSERYTTSGRWMQYGESPSRIPTAEGEFPTAEGEFVTSRGEMGTSGGMVGTSKDSELKARASETAQGVKEKAYELKERAGDMVGQARERASHLRERIPEGSEVKQRASHWFDRMMDTQPMFLALGGIALGMLASSFAPVSRRERQLMGPAKRKAEDRLSQFGEQIEQKIAGEGRGIEEEEIRSSAASEAGRERGEIPPLPKLDEYTSVH